MRVTGPQAATSTSTSAALSVAPASPIALLCTQWHDTAEQRVVAVTLPRNLVASEHGTFRSRAAAWPFLACMYLMWRLLGDKPFTASAKATKAAAHIVGIEATELA